MRAGGVSFDNVANNPAFKAYAAFIGEYHEQAERDYVDRWLALSEIERDVWMCVSRLIVFVCLVMFKQQKDATSNRGRDEYE